MHHILMDDISMENWQKVKDAMEASGSTNNFYYKRACAILGGQKDPINAILRPAEVDYTPYEESKDYDGEERA